MSDDLKSRSQIKRVVAQDPAAVIAEIERLRAAYNRLVSLLEEYAEQEERHALKIGRPDITSVARTTLAHVAKELAKPKK